MDKLKLHSPNLTEANIEKIAELFPSCIVEAKNDKGDLTRKIDFDQLRQELSDSIVEGAQERYRLDWPGKREALLASNAPIAKTLRPCREQSVEFDTTQNLFIEGDNLEALKLLQETYLGKVKMIYIDPPYNTGKDFIYDDNFAEDAGAYFERSNQKDESGKLVTNPESKGRFHSSWLSMMYGRLKLARNLLCDDGAVFISIDDHEQSDLQKLCDEVFGGENFIGMLSVENNPKGRKNSNFLSVSNDFCLIYAKNKEKSHFVENIPKSADDMKQDEDGNYVHKSGKRVLVGENNFNKEVTDLKSDKHYSTYYRKQDKSIVIKKEKDLNYLDNELLSGGYLRYISSRDGRYIENTYTSSKLLDLHAKEALEVTDSKIFEKNFNSTIRMKSLLTNKSYKALSGGQIIDFKVDVKTTSARTYLKALFESNEPLFNAPKSVGLVKLLVTLFEDRSLVVLDFFAGSSTTADAVMQQNAEDGGKRHFVMVQLPEVCGDDSAAFKAGYNTIAEISKERIRRAGKKIKDENATIAADLDVGFRVLKIDSSNAKDIYYTPDAISQDELALQVDHIKEDRTAEDLLFQVMLDWGVDLALPISKEPIQGKDVYFVDENAIAACFDTKINEDFVKELAKREPLRVVFRDTCFESDSAKINVAEIFKLLSPNTDIKTI